MSPLHERIRLWVQGCISEANIVLDTAHAFDEPGTHSFTRTHRTIPHRSAAHRTAAQRSAASHRVALRRVTSTTTTPRCVPKSSDPDWLQSISSKIASPKIERFSSKNL
jgi:hypothetical protein